MTIEYLTIGHGSETVIVLPDWFGGSAYLAALGHRVDTARYRYIVLDFRGYGKSRDRKGEFSIAEMAADALDVADAIGAHRFHLLGHSMGGKAAQWLAARHADRLKSAVALTPTPPIALSFDVDTRTLLEDCATSIDSRRIALNIATGSQYGQGFIDRIADISIEASDPHAYRAYLDAWSGTDIRADAGQSEFPLHVVIGARDPFVPEGVMREHVGAIFPNMRLSVIPDVGHYPFLEAPPRAATIAEAEFAANG